MGRRKRRDGGIHSRAVPDAQLLPGVASVKRNTARHAPARPVAATTPPTAAPACGEVGLAPSLREQVLRLARLAMAAGSHGVVASAQEAARLRGELPPGALIVCPGIQLPTSGASDQARVATPGAAARVGASHVVIGRGITAAADPAGVFQAARAAFLAQGD